MSGEEFKQEINSYTRDQLIAKIQWLHDNIYHRQKQLEEEEEKFSTAFEKLDEFQEQERSLCNCQYQIYSELLDMLQDLFGNFLENKRL